MSKIKITLNGEEFNFEESKTISDLVKHLDLDVTKIAIEKNYNIVAPENFQDFNIEQGDKIEIVSFIGGG